MVTKNWSAILGTFMCLVGFNAHADILFIDTNNQGVEQRTIDELGRRYGERVHVVKGDGPELEEVFRRADAGEIRLRTIVGSGHSSGTSFGGAGGSLTANIDKVLAQFPNAREQVRHFIGLGCYTGTKYNTAEWQSRFPNATVIAGFNGIAPSGTWSARFLDTVMTSIMSARSAAGGSDDAFARRLATNSSAVNSLKQSLAALQAVRITVASFQICDNFWDPKGRSVEKVRTEIQQGLNMMRGYLNGWGHDDVPPDPHAPSPLRTFYNDLQAYLGNATPEEREELVKAKEQTIRLIYFTNVKQNFARTLSDADIAKANEAFEVAGTKRGYGDDAKPMRFPTRQQIATMKRGEIANLISSMGYSIPSALDPASVEAHKRLVEEYDRLKASVPPVAPADPADVAAADEYKRLLAEHNAKIEDYNRRAGGSSLVTDPNAAVVQPVAPPEAPKGPTEEQVAATKAFYDKLKKELVDLDVPFSYIDTPPAG